MSASISTAALPTEALNLGNPRAEFTAQTRQMVTSGIVFVVFAAACAAVGILADSTGALIALGALALLFFGAGGWQFYQAFDTRSLRIVVMDQGIVRAKGSGAEVARWDDVDTFTFAITDHYRNGVKTGTTHIYTLTLRDGRKIVYNDVIRNVAALGDMIQDMVTPRLLPKYAERLQRGETLTFNRLVISRDRIGTSKQTVPWSEIDSVDLKRGQVVVTKQGKPLGWISQTVAQTPNLLVFLTLANRLKETR